MAEQKFKIGDRVKIVDFTGTIIGVKFEDNSIKYHVKIDNGRIYTWVSQSSLKLRITDTQRTVLEGLYLLGCRYLACDKNNYLYAYSTRPEKDEINTMWDSYEWSIPIYATTDIMINLCSWEDEKPTSIEWLLGKKDKNE